MAATTYFVRTDGDSVLIGVPVTNTSDTTSGAVSVVFGAFNATLTLTDTYVDKGTYTTLSRTWSGFTLAPNETQTIYLKFTVADIDLTPITVTGTISGAVDGNDASGTAVSVTIKKEDDTLTHKVYTILLDQTGTSAPTATVLRNTLGAVPTLARTGVGVYTITTSTLFTANKTFITLQPDSTSLASADEQITQTSTSVITLSTFDGTPAAVDFDGRLYLEVRVYP